MTSISNDELSQIHGGILWAAAAPLVIKGIKWITISAACTAAAAYNKQSQKNLTNAMEDYTENQTGMAELLGIQPNTAGMQ